MKPGVTILLVAVGGAVGALARYGLTGLVQGNRYFPYGTLAVNILGCLLMGFLARWIEVGNISAELRILFGLGFLGAFTTFSTFSYETLQLVLQHNLLAAGLNVAGSVIGCLASVAVGYLLARAIWPG